MNIWVNDFLNLTQEEAEIIHYASRCDKELILVCGDVGFNPTNIYDELPAFSVEEAWRSYAFGCEKIDDYNFWFSIHDEWAGYGVQFFYPASFENDGYVTIRYAGAIKGSIKWIHGMEGLVRWKIQIIIWNYLLTSRQSELGMPRRYIKRLKQKIKGFELSRETLRYYL